MATRAENMELSNERTGLLQLSTPQPYFEVVKSEKKRLTFINNIVPTTKFWYQRTINIAILNGIQKWNSRKRDHGTCLERLTKIMKTYGLYESDLNACPRR